MAKPIDQQHPEREPKAGSDPSALREWPDVDEIPEYGEVVGEPEEGAAEDRAEATADTEEGARDA